MATHSFTEVLRKLENCQLSDCPQKNMRGHNLTPTQKYLPGSVIFYDMLRVEKERLACKLVDFRFKSQSACLLIFSMDKNEKNSDFNAKGKKHKGNFLTC